MRDDPGSSARARLEKWRRSAPGVTVRDLTVRYGGHAAVDGASFELAQGRALGLIGRNGAGKSTTIRALAGLIPSSAGALEILGATVSRNDPSRARLVGYLLDSPALFSYLTPGETLGFLAELYRIPRSEATTRTADLLEFFELNQFGNKLVDELSTGTIKRLAIAAAMIHNPRVLILDEPFESLDPLMVRRLRKRLRRFADEGGTVLVSSHLIASVQDLCDDIVIMEEGRVLMAGSAESVLSAGSSGHGPELEEVYASLLEEGPPPELEWFGT
jgi:ABC-2 type transport system ATP-binding protein